MPRFGTLRHSYKDLDRRPDGTDLREDVDVFRRFGQIVQRATWSFAILVGISRHERHQLFQTVDLSKLRGNFRFRRELPDRGSSHACLILIIL